MDHTGAHNTPEVTTAGVQQHTHQLNVSTRERRSLSVVNLNSTEETVEQDTTVTSELTIDHTRARVTPGVTTAGVQQHTYQLNASTQERYINLNQSQQVQVEQAVNHQPKHDAAPSGTATGCTGHGKRGSGGIKVC